MLTLAICCPILTLSPKPHPHHRAKSAKKQPAHVAPPAEEHSPQWKAHHFIHDVLLPLTYKHESLSTGKRKSDPLALSTEIVSHPLMIQTVTSLEEDMMTLFEHFCTKKQVSITDQRTQVVSEYQVRKCKINHIPIIFDPLTLTLPPRHWE